MVCVSTSPWSWEVIYGCKKCRPEMKVTHPLLGILLSLSETEINLILIDWLSVTVQNKRQHLRMLAAKSEPAQA